MKIRNGFVSNSSSSSFVLKGFLLDDIDNYKIVEFFKNNYPDFYDKTISRYDTNDIENEDFLTEIGSYLSCPIKIEKGIECENGLPEDKWFIGEELAIIDDLDFNDTQIYKLELGETLTKLQNELDIKEQPKIIIGTCMS